MFRRGQEAREASAPSLAFFLAPCAGGCHRWLGCGAAVVLHRAAVSRAPAQFSATQEQDQSRQHRQPLRSLLQKEKHPGNLVQTRCRAAPGVAGGSRGGPSRRPMLAGMNASTAPSLPPTPCAGCVSRCGLRLGSFALPGRCSLRPHVTWRRTAAPSPFTWQVARHSPQCGRLRCKIQLPSARPHVYRAKLNTAAFLAGNPVNFPHLARVEPLYDNAVYQPQRKIGALPDRKYSDCIRSGV